MVIIHTGERKILNMIFKQRILLFLVVSFFISYSSVAYAVDYGSGLYGSDSYSVTTQENKSSSSSGFYNKQQPVNIPTVTPPNNIVETLPKIEENLPKIETYNQKQLENKKKEDNNSENIDSTDESSIGDTETVNEYINIDRTNFWEKNKLLLLINILFVIIIIFWFFTKKRRN